MKTVILKHNYVIKEEEKRKLEQENSEKLQANVVILDAKFDKAVHIIE